MKKRTIKIIFLTIISFCIGFLAYEINSKLNYKKEVTKRIQNLPNFTFHSVKVKTFTRENLPDKPVIFVYFNSDCDYCKSEATKIQEHLTDFKNTLLVFISFEGVKDITQFAKDYKLYKIENVLFLEDREAKFSQIFDVNSIPYIVVYDKNKKLLRKFKGATKIDDILKVLE